MSDKLGDLSQELGRLVFLNFGRVDIWATCPASIPAIYCLYFLLLFCSESSALSNVNTISILLMDTVHGGYQPSAGSS